MTWVVTADRVRELHVLGIEKWGDITDGAETAGCVEGSIGAAVSAGLYLSDNDEPDPISVVAHLLVYLAKNHCFGQGNKRVAWLTGMDQLAVLGLGVEGVTDDAAVEFMFAIERNEISADDAHVWLADRLTAAAP